MYLFVYLNRVCVKSGLTHEEVLAQGIMFLMVGYETTATTLAFLAYLLAVNSDCQDKLIAEIDDVMQGQVRHVYLRYFYCLFSVA